jgi:hypothetical protein
MISQKICTCKKKSQARHSGKKNNGWPWLGIFIFLFAIHAQAQHRPLLIVTTDIGQDPDDQQSLVRLLHYANEFNLAGIIVNADNNHSHEPPILKDTLAHQLIDAYGLIENQLRLHDPNFPSALYLHSLVKKGCFGNGVNVPVSKYIGEGMDTEGSDWIIRVVDGAGAGPVCISAWGGACDLAQALYKVRKTRTPDQTNLFIAKLRVYFTGKQDSSNDWILGNFPGLWTILSLHPGGDKWASAYRGMFAGGDVSLTSSDWLHRHIIGKNALSGLYPDSAYTGGGKINPHMAMKEGDSPSWMYFLSNGLNNINNPEWGGWGGRFKRTKDLVFNDAADCYTDIETGASITDARATVFRWRDDFQRDFAARAEWGSKSYADANHRPLIRLKGQLQDDPLLCQVKGGKNISFNAGPSVDPDGDRLRFHWFIYPEAGTYSNAGKIATKSNYLSRIKIKVPKDAKGSSIHLILRVTDNRTHSLTSYKRIIIEAR